VLRAPLRQLPHPPRPASPAPGQKPATPAPADLPDSPFGDRK
jgi:hypothetical protein